MKLLAMLLAYKGIPTSKMIFELGKGGDGKGTERRLEKGVMGHENSSTLDCGVFFDRKKISSISTFRLEYVKRSYSRMRREHQILSRSLEMICCRRRT